MKKSLRSRVIQFIMAMAFSFFVVFNNCIVKVDAGDQDEEIALLVERSIQLIKSDKTLGTLLEEYGAKFLKDDPYIAHKLKEFLDTVEPMQGDWKSITQYINSIPWWENLFGKFPLKIKLYILSKMLQNVMWED